MYQICIDSETRTPVDMEKVFAALTEAGIDFEKPEEHQIAESVFVDESQIANAVAAINGLGYVTDEDQGEDEGDDSGEYQEYE